MFSNRKMPEAPDFDENRKSIFSTCRSKIVAFCIVTEYQCDSFWVVGSHLYMVKDHDATSNIKDVMVMFIENVCIGLKPSPQILAVKHQRCHRRRNILLFGKQSRILVLFPPMSTICVFGCITVTAGIYILLVFFSTLVNCRQVCQQLYLQT